MNRSSRTLALGAVLLTAGLTAQRVQTGQVQDRPPEVTVYKSPT